MALDKRVKGRLEVLLRAFPPRQACLEYLLALKRLDENTERLRRVALVAVQREMMLKELPYDRATVQHRFKELQLELLHDPRYLAEVS